MDRKFIEIGKRSCFSLQIKMIFKRMYCCKCGKKLSTKFISTNYRPDLKWIGAFHESSELTISANGYMPKGTEYFEGRYICKNCNYMISYETQNHIRKYQDAGRRRILTENEINSYNLLPKDEDI